MIETILSITTLIYEATLSIVVAVFDFFVGLFLGAGETILATDAMALLVVLLAEFIVWCLLVVKMLITSLITLKKPKPIPKPVFWRPKIIKKTLRKTVKLKEGKD